MFGYLGVPARDLKNLIALEMLAIILGEGTSSRLYVNLVENMEENIFNMIDAENYSFRDGSNFFVQANFNPEYKEKAKQSKTDMFISKHDFNQDYFLNSIKYLLSSSSKSPRLTKILDSS